MFVKIENDGFALGAQRKELTTSDLPDAVEAINNYQLKIKNGETFDAASLPLNALVVEKTKVAENGEYNLGADRYKVDIGKKQTKFEMVSLGNNELFHVESGGTPDSTNEKYWNGNIKWATLVDLPQTDFITKIKDTKRTITEAGLKSSSAKLIPKNSILISSRATIGRVGINEIDLATNQGFKIILIKNKEKVLTEFVALMVTQLKDKMENLAAGGTFKEISKTNFCTLQIPLPPLSIQQEIVAKIEQYEKIITGAKQIVENYKPEIDINPEWEMVELGSIAKIIGGGTPSKEIKEYWDGGDIDWVSCSDFSNNAMYLSDSIRKITKAGLENSSSNLIDEETLILVSRVSLGKLAFTRKKTAINQDLTALNFTSKSINKFFVYYYLLSISSKIQEDGNGITVKGINRDYVKNIPIPLPPLSEQQIIVAQIENEQQLVNTNKQLIQIFEQKIKNDINKLWVA